MFTGIVEEVGTIRALERRPDGVILSIRASFAPEGLVLGDSVNVNGACLTVTSLDAGGFTVGLSPETLRRTSLGSIGAGSPVNLERALRVGDRLGGHIVQGHVDGVGTVVGLRPEGDSMVVSLEAPANLAPYIVEKGFVGLDGISLTVAERTGRRFSVALVAYTREHVALVHKGVGDPVNIEVDVIAKYVESILDGRPEAGRRPVEGEA